MTCRLPSEVTATAKDVSSKILCLEGKTVLDGKAEGGMGEGETLLGSSSLVGIY